jgi:hypothetical protein
MTPMEIWNSAANALTADLQRVFGRRLQAVVAYGPAVDGRAEAPLTCLALTDTLTLPDLEACAARTAEWERRHIAPPLLLTAEEFRRSLDAFPLEYGEILRTHVRVFGDDPFVGLTIARDDLRRACEAQVKSHLLHLREGFLEARGQPDAIADLVVASAPGFAALLRNVARLTGVTITERVQATYQGAQAANLPEGVVRAVLAFEQPTSIPTGDPARRFGEYLAAVEQLARAVDGWK